MIVQRKNDFTQGKISQNILSLAIPMTVAQLTVVLYNMVDRAFIGHIPVVGKDAFTGVGLVMPITYIITAFANLSGMGGAPLFSMARGKGDDEHQSEARAMADYLEDHGVAPERIILEDQSRNTWQNVNNTLALLRAGAAPQYNGNVLLVSSDFHLTRIGMLWRRAAGEDCVLSTLAAPVSHLPSRVQMFFREPFALVKSFLFDR